MKRKFLDVESSTVKGLAKEGRRIYVKFHGGKVYSYAGSQAEYEAFVFAPSKGRYFNENIKGRKFRIEK